MIQDDSCYPVSVLITIIPYKNYYYYQSCCYMPSPVRPSARHTGGSVKDG